MMNTLYIVRGLPGSGKSTVARKMTAVVTEADQFFMVDNEYRFDGTKLGAAHADCLARTREALTHGDCAVANTFTQTWEIEPYIKAVRELGARFVIVDVFDGGLTDEALAARNAHGVPVEAIAKMRARYEFNLKLGR